MMRNDECTREDGGLSPPSRGGDSHGKNTSRIARLRTMAGLTQKELACKVGGPYQWVQKLEAGSIDIGNITLNKALALADALGVEVRELIGDD